MKDKFPEYNEEIEHLIRKAFKSKSRNPEKTSLQPKCFRVFLLSTIFLLSAIVFAILFLVQHDSNPTSSPQIRIFGSFVEKNNYNDSTSTETEIIKPFIDKRVYKAIKLPNEMKVMMISDPDSSLGAAAVDVNVGYFADPMEMQGLAHFCEHMLFLQSKKHTELNGFQTFLASYDGRTNAFTIEENTNFFFETTSTGFGEALERFSDLFVNPMITQDLMEEEVKAIDGELHRNLHDENWRLRYVLQLIANPKNPISKFNTGSTESLIKNPKERGVDIVGSLQKFFNDYYSANVMSLVVLDNKPLDEIEELVKKTFSQVPNKQIEVPNYSNIPWPFSGEFGNKVVQYIPIYPLKALRLIFSVESSYKYPFLDPYEYLIQLISDKGEGGLLSVLKEKNLAFDLDVGSIMITSEFELFSIATSIEAQDFKDAEQIIKVILAYLDLIATEGVQKELYQQYANISSHVFNYVPNIEAVMSEVSDIAIKMHIFDEKHSVSDSSTSKKFDEDLLRKCLKQFNADNMMVFLMDPEFEVSLNPKATEEFIQIRQEDSSDTKEQKEEGKKLEIKKLDEYDSIYDISYAVSDLPKGLLQELKEINHKDFPELKLPDANKFLSNNFTLAKKPCPLGKKSCKQNYEADADQHQPNKVLENDYIRVWHQLDRSSKTPLVTGNIVFYSDEIIKDLAAQTLACLKVQLIAVVLEDELNDIFQSGNKAKMTALGIQFTAFSDILPKLLSDILEKYKDFDFTEEQFALARTNLVSLLYYDVTQEPARNLLKYKAKLLLEYYYLENEIFSLLQKVDYFNFKKLSEGLYSSLYTESLFIGNILDSQAKTLGENIINVLGYKPTKDKKPLENRVLNIVGKNLVVRVPSPVTNGTQNYILNTYQDGILSVKSVSYMNILIKILDPEVYTFLRTEKQMCYAVGTSPERTKNILSLNIQVESHSYDPNELDENIELCLQRGEKKLQELTDSQFRNIIESMKQTLQNKAESLFDRANSYMNHITNQDYIFDLRDRVEKYLPKLSKEGLLRYFQNLVKTPRKLSIQFYNGQYEKIPTETLPKEKQFSQTDAVLITDLGIIDKLERYPIETRFDEAETL